MQHIETSTYTVPALFFLICIFSAFSLLLATYFWMWQSLRGNTATSLTQTLIQFQYQSLISVSIFSCINGLFDSVFYKNTNNLTLEILIILCFFLCDLFRKKKPNLISKAKLVFIHFFALCCFISLNIALGWVLSHTLQTFYNSFINAGDGVIFATLIIGGCWNLPLILYYKRLSPEQKQKTKLHNAMTPVLLAYILLLTPLMVQSIANSPKWDELKHAPKPIKKAELTDYTPSNKS